MQRRVARSNRHRFTAVYVRTSAGNESSLGITSRHGTDTLISSTTEFVSVASPAEHMVEPRPLNAPAELPCQAQDPDLWFSDSPAQLHMAKTICADCPARTACLAGAIRRREPWGVWGGEIFQQGRIITQKRARGRPRKHDIVIPDTWTMTPSAY